MIEHILEAQRLQVSLNPVDVKINHHFFERPIRPLESKVAILSLDSLPGGFGSHERTVEVTARF